MELHLNALYFLISSPFILYSLYQSVQNEYYHKEDINLSIITELFFNYINITYSVDSNWYLYLIVSISSIMEHSTNDKLWYNIYLLTCPNFHPIARERVLNLTNKYDRLSIYHIEINKSFPNNIKYHGSCSAELRLFLPEILLDVTKIIHLDVDTYTFKDLDNFYNIDMKNLSFYGNLDLDYFHDLNKVGVPENDHYINSGVILMNLEQLRKINFIQKVCNFTEKYGQLLSVPDQTIINAVTYGSLGILPPEIGFHNIYCDERRYKNYFRAHYYYNYFTHESIRRIIYNLTIVHYVPDKPWQRSIIYGKEWGLMALKTDYGNEIISKIPWLRNALNYQI